MEHEATANEIANHALATSHALVGIGNILNSPDREDYRENIFADIQEVISSNNSLIGNLLRYHGGDIHCRMSSGCLYTDWD